MKTRGFSLIELLVVVAVIAVVATMVTGCASNAKVDRLMAMTETQAKRQAYTEEVALALAKRGGTVMADTLANMEPGGAAGWSKAERAIRLMNGEPLLVDGKPVFETIEAVGKSRSGRDVAGVTKGSLTLAGLPRGKDGDIDTTAPFDGFRLEIEAAAGNTGPSTEWMRAYMEGVAAEKAAIIGGMATMAEKRGAAFAVRVNAVSKGVAEFLTAAGPIVGKVMRVNPVVAAADLAELGITKIAEATVQTGDGATAKVLVADTAAASTASAVAQIAAANPEASAAVPASK